LSLNNLFVLASEAPQIRSESRRLSVRLGREFAPRDIDRSQLHILIRTMLIRERYDGEPVIVTRIMIRLGKTCDASANSGAAEVRRECEVARFQIVFVSQGRVNTGDTYTVLQASRGVKRCALPLLDWTDVYFPDGSCLPLISPHKTYGARCERAREGRRKDPWNIHDSIPRDAAASPLAQLDGTASRRSSMTW